MGNRPAGSGQGPRDSVPASAPLCRTVRISNPLGLHYRAADRFCRAAREFGCLVTVWNGEVRADGKSLTDLILLVALPGAELVLQVDGPDAGRALDPLAEILAAPGGEDYEI